MSKLYTVKQNSNQYVHVNIELGVLWDISRILLNAKTINIRLYFEGNIGVFKPYLIMQTIYILPHFLWLIQIIRNNIFWNKFTILVKLAHNQWHGSYKVISLKDE